jgi:hypothetical protein
MAPATHAAMAAVSTKLVEAPAAITPIATLATETIPSLAPSTAARSHPARCPLWRTLFAVRTVPSLSTDVTDEARIAEVIAQAKKAGATVLKPAQRAQWGWYFGHFSDPAGYVWKVSGC